MVVKIEIVNKKEIARYRVRLNGYEIFWYETPGEAIRYTDMHNNPVHLSTEEYTEIREAVYKAKEESYLQFTSPRVGEPHGK